MICGRWTLIESERVGFVKSIKGYEVERRTGRGVVLRDGDELIYACEGGWEPWCVDDNDSDEPVSPVSCGKPQSEDR